ncbi:Nucleosomal histone H3-Lys79 methylase [Rhizina undulata]
MSSFFAKFNKPGTTPITQQKYVVKTVSVPTPSNSSSSAPARRPNPAISTPHSSRKQQGESSRSAPSSKSKLSTTVTASSASAGKASLKRKYDATDSSKSTPTPAVSKRKSSDLLKPPSPESQAPSSRGRTNLSSSRSPRSIRLESSDESSASDDEDERASKRTRPSLSPGAVIDGKRKLVNPLSFRKSDYSSATVSEEGFFIHAEKIANAKIEGYGTSKRVFKKSDQKLMVVGLNYPGISQAERYQLVQHDDPDEFSPVDDILITMENVAKHLLTPTDGGDEIHSETSGGIVYRMRRSLKRGEPAVFMDELKKYNKLIRLRRRNGILRRNIANMATLPFPLVEHILQQAYARTVALEVDRLRDYTPFGNNVYGELLPKFTTKIFKDAGLTSDKVFVDLGSGTGNVVLHAALEIGCESWGCEIMENAAGLGKKQRKEFEARCRMWGLNPGKIVLILGDFLENARIVDVLKRVDVLLVNNYAFSSTLNQRLLDMFLDLKEGTQIISLKSFVPANHVITTRNAENPVNRLRVEEKEYFSNSVSWTDAGGKYYVHTVDGSMLREFMEKEESRRAESEDANS